MFLTVNAILFCASSDLALVPNQRNIYRQVKPFEAVANAASTSEAQTYISFLQKKPTFLGWKTDLKIQGIFGYVTEGNGLTVHHFVDGINYITHLANITLTEREKIYRGLQYFVNLYQDHHKKTMKSALNRVDETFDLYTHYLGKLQKLTAGLAEGHHGDTTELQELSERMNSFLKAHNCENGHEFEQYLQRLCPRKYALYKDFFESARTSIESSSNAYQGPDEERPNEHYCPITLCVMQEPVIACDGHSYERTAILRHFENSNVSPKTGLRIERALISNFTLKMLIRDWEPRKKSVSTALHHPDTKTFQHVASNKQALHPVRTTVAPQPQSFSGLVIPDIARGHEDVYRRFYNGRLIYRKGTPDEVVFPIAALSNPLDGVFNQLSGNNKSGNTIKFTDLKDSCGYPIDRYLQIATGYKKAKNSANSNKVEVWFAPRFLIERELGTSAKHFAGIMDSWQAATAPVGIFWTWGGDDVTTNSYDYLTTQGMNGLCVRDLFGCMWWSAMSAESLILRDGDISYVVCELR